MLDGWPPPIFDPAGPYAWPVTVLGWVLLAMAAAVLAVVLAALYVAIRGKARLKSRLGGEKAIWIGGIAFPAIVLSILLVYGLSLTRQLSSPAPAGAMVVRVSATTLRGDCGAPAKRCAGLSVEVSRNLLALVDTAAIVYPQLSGQITINGTSATGALVMQAPVRVRLASRANAATIPVRSPLVRAAPKRVGTMICPRSGS